jgi:hypothetical protein
LFSTITTSGAFCTQAKLKPSWKAPVDVPPSPIQVSATVFFPFMRSAISAPVRIGTMSPSIDTTAMLLPSSRIQPKCVFRSRPPEGPSRRAMYWQKISRGRPPRTNTAPRLRISGVKMSPYSSA